jgi:hypothetical protein
LIPIDPFSVTPAKAGVQGQAELRLWLWITFGELRFRLSPE